MPLYPFPVIVLDTVNSTNLFAQQLVNNHRVEQATVVLAYHQSEGRGQRGNKWVAGYGENLTFSVIFFPEQLHVSRHFMLNRVFSLAVHDFLQSYGLKNAKVKWPNDVIVNDKKIAGILLENSVRGEHINTIIAGIGVNINQDNFNDDYSFPPVSLRQLTGNIFNINSCLDDLLMHILYRYDQLVNNKTEILKGDYLQTLYMVNQQHIFQNGDIKWKGIIRDVTEDGQLRIEDENGKITIHGFNETRMVAMKTDLRAD